MLQLGGPRSLEIVEAATEEDFHDLPFEIGKPEPLSGDLSGFWSRKVSSEHRIVYQVTDKAAYFLACRSHYGDK